MKTRLKLKKKDYVPDANYGSGLNCYFLAWDSFEKFFYIIILKVYVAKFPFFPLYK